MTRKTSELDSLSKLPHHNNGMEFALTYYLGVQQAHTQKESLSGINSDLGPSSPQSLVSYLGHSGLRLHGPPCWSVVESSGTPIQAWPPRHRLWLVKQ
ncbi:hypothetical protein AVEN_917-1 [Araneus ventricosus]|uniref:Uncharacterized protein n=1 Tax=Araneus ventricosus TaxID=182803 RepID=A0A4Y2BZ82_ARAVE|nr:hypothetical protein AVEN_917-1 [Araneus ventricosus]